MCMCQIRDTFVCVCACTLTPETVCVRPWVAVILKLGSNATVVETVGLSTRPVWCLFSE